MRHPILFCIIALVLISAPVRSDSADIAHPELPRISAQGLKELMDKKGDYILVDSRDSSKYNQEHIEGAINIHYDFSGDPMVRSISLMALPMEKLIIVYCDFEGEKASAGLVMDLFDLGFDMDNVWVLSEGITRWKKLGYPVISSKVLKSN